MVAVRPRVPALACLARRRRPAVRAPSQVEPAEGGPRQGPDHASRSDHQRRGRPLTLWARAPVGGRSPPVCPKMAPDSDLETVASANRLRESWEGTKNVCIVLRRTFDHEDAARG